MGLLDIIGGPGSLIGAGISAIGSVAGGVMAAKKMEQARDVMTKQIESNNDWFNRRYNESMTGRADAVAMIGKMREALAQRGQAQAGANAVMGASAEAVAQQKAANSQAIADTMAQLAVAGEQRKDNIESAYRQQDANLNNQLAQNYQQQAEQIAKAGQAATQAGANIMTNAMANHNK